MPAGAISSINGEECIARWSAAEVKRLARQAVEALKSDARLTGEVLVFYTSPRVERFNQLDPQTIHHLRSPSTSSPRGSNAPSR
ncbi:MAG: hypothetical protein ACLQPH_08455 [Acidimicrobiales bacterium]